MLIAVTAIAIVVGIAGTLLPFVPGIGLVWAAVLAYVVLDGFGADSWIVLLIVTVIGGAGIYLGYRIPQKAANDGGIGWQGQVFAVGLAVVGFFVIPVVGAPIGFVLGVFLSMLVIDRGNAWPATRETLRSFVVASGIQFSAATLMGLVWFAWVAGGWILD